MPNKVVSDSFENLTSAAQNVVGGAKTVVKQMGNDVVENVGVKPPQTGSSEQGGGTQPQQKTDDQIKKMDASAKNVARKRYVELQNEIKQLQQKRVQEMTKYHKPGNTDEEKQKNEIKQLEEKKPENKLPEVVKQSAHKTEKFRGSSG